MNIQKYKTAIVIPFGLTWNWVADYEKKTAITLAKSKENLVIVFLAGDGISIVKQLFERKCLWKKIASNFYIFRPIYILPFQKKQVIQKVNFFFSSLQIRLLIYILEKRHAFNKLFWTFSLQYSVFPNYFDNSYLKIYDCVDAFVSEDRSLKKHWERYEKIIIGSSDIVFTNQHTLYKRLYGKHDKLFRVPIGFSLDEFIKNSTFNPSDIADIPHPRIAFIGNINNRIDFPLMNHLIRLTPQYHYLFIGKEDANFTVPNVDFNKEIHMLKKFPNVHFLGEKPREQIPGYMKSIDIGIIPYSISQVFNKMCFPMKCLEYFYMGKPVLSTPILEMKKLTPYVKIFSTPNEGLKILSNIVEHPWPEKYRKQQEIFSKNNSWEQKIKIIRSILSKNYNVAI